MAGDGPHDSLLKFTFGSPEHATAELKAILPPRVAAAADWGSLQLRPSEHAHLSVGRSDLLYSLNIGGTETLVYLLFEHSSTAPRFMPLTFFRYVMGIWSDFHAEHPSALLPPVLPIVLHHSERGWSGPRTLLELVELPAGLEAELTPFIPSFGFLLDDISHVSDEGLRNRALTGPG
jgi:hypothetical protein